jgi:hypothetical protein
MLGHTLVFCEFEQLYVGTPENIVDVFFITVTLQDVSNPESYEDLVELLIPVIMERGIMWNDYAVPGGIFRENLHLEKDVKTLPTNHQGGRFRYEELKERLGTDEFRDITIKRMRRRRRWMCL